MSSEKSKTPEKPEVPSLPGNLDDLPAYVAPWPTNRDYQYGRTIPRENAGPSILSRNPDDPPEAPPTLPPSNPRASDLFVFPETRAEPLPASLPARSRRALPASSSRRRLPPSARRRLPPSARRPAPSRLPAAEPAAPTPAKRAKKPLSQKAKNNGPISSSPATSVSIPRWGVDFPKTGFSPSGSILERGSLKGHYSKEACRSSPPVGTSEEDWKKKFRSAESVLMKQLKQIYGNKAGKVKLDEMRDEGWVRDRALYMLEVEKEKKAAKGAAGEKKDEDEDVEMAEGEEVKEAEEEAEEDVKDEEMEDVWGGDEEDDPYGIYNA